MKQLIILFVAFLGFIQCKKENKSSEITSNTISVIDASGNKMKLSTPPRRVVVLYEPLLELIYMLGTEQTLVGIPTKTYTSSESYDYFSLLDENIKQKKIATPGDFESANQESIIALNPDLVLAYDLPESVVENLNRMGIAVYLGKAETYDNIKKETQDLGIIFRKEKRSQQLLSFVEHELTQIKNETNQLKPKSAYFSWANGRIFSTTGTQSMMHQCLIFGGVTNVCTTKLDQANINPETLVAWNPDLIYMWNDSPELFYEHKQLSKVEAIKNKAVYNLLPMFFYNPHTLKAVSTARRIQNWAYKLKTEEEVLQILQAYLEQLYGKEKAQRLLPKLK